MEQSIPQLPRPTLIPVLNVQLPRFWLNERAVENIFTIETTFATFQFPIFGLKSEQPLNNELNFPLIYDTDPDAPFVNLPIYGFILTSIYQNYQLLNVTDLNASTYGKDYTLKIDVFEEAT